MALMSLKEAQLREEELANGKLPPDEHEEENIEGEQEQPPEGDQSQKGEVEENSDWAKGDDEPAGEGEGGEGDSEELNTDAVAAKVRRKWKGRLKEQQDENAQLRQELEDLKKAVAQPRPQAPAAVSEPQRDAYNTDAEYQRALTVYLLDQREAEAKSQRAVIERKAETARILEQISTDVESHYQRAISLAKKSSITPEAYQSADRTFRQAIEDMRPGEGDALVDGLIHIVGDGSERVFYKLGVSKVHREKALELLRADRTGLRLTAYLGQLNSELKPSAKRQSNAPDPAPKVQGDKVNGSATASKERKEYDKLMNSGKAQEAWNIKKAMKAKGINTTDW